MVVQKKKPTKFTLLKKKSTDTTSTTQSANSNIIEDEEKVIITKPILKLKKDKVEEKEEKKKVIFQTEKNQTQLFNKTLKISDKPLVMPKVIKGSALASSSSEISDTVNTETAPSTSSISAASSSSENLNGSQKKSLTSTTKSTAALKKTMSNKKKSSKVVEEPVKPIEEDQDKDEEEPQQMEEEPVVDEANEAKEAEEEEQTFQVEQQLPPIKQVSKVNNKKDKQQINNINNNSNSNSNSNSNNINNSKDSNDNNIKDQNNNNKSKKEEINSDSSSDESDKEVKNKKNSNGTISGFNILPISIENAVFKKYLYIKKETSKKWPSNKTLFVTNLPSNCRSLEDIKKLFKYDYIESVHFGQPKQQDQQPFYDDEEQVEKIDETTLHVAHIVMKDQDSLQLFLKKSHTLSIQQSSTNINGFDSMLAQYNSNVIHDYDSLQEKLDNIMMDYDRRALETKKRSKQRQQPDADGFITVGPSSAKVMTAEEVKALMAKKDKKNFYAFQHRQQKKDELETLRKKFEEDKQKIAKITAARKFKPY